MFKIIDSHCHIYPEGIALKAVDAVDRFYDHLPADHYDGTTQTLVKSGTAAGISHFIARSMAESGGRFTGMGTMHLESDDLARDFAEIVELGLRGVKLHPDIQRFNADDPRAMRIYEMCEAAGLPVCVHTGDYRYDYSNPPRVVNILKAFPKLKFIGAHFGGWSVWNEAARTLPEYPNIIVDSSSSFYAMPPEKAKVLIRIWGAERVMFGTDYPLWPQRRDIDYLLGLELTDGEYEAIFWKNVTNLFGICTDEQEDATHES